MDWARLQSHLISGFRLDSFSAHDQDHWRRVELYGIYLAPMSGADLEIVRLFAWLHDSQRESEGHDPLHGERAESVARSLCGNYFQLSADRLELLALACRDHEKGRTSPDPTVGVCWDADRLDLDRVGKTTDPDYLSSLAARELAKLRPVNRRRKVGAG